MPRKQFPDVSGKYGAPMGRPAVMDNPTAEVRVFRVRFVDGDYDDGGAYWGGGRDSQPLYCARGEGVELFTRAATHVEAKRNFLAHHPGLVIRGEPKRRTLSMSRIKRTYGPKIVAILNDIKAAFEGEPYTVSDPEEMSDEEYQWDIYVVPTDEDNDRGIDIKITILESKARDGEDDFGINFGLGVVGYEGIIIGGFTPYNYTNDIWVSRKDPEAVEERWQLFADGVDPAAVVDSINERSNA